MSEPEPGPIPDPVPEKRSVNVRWFLVIVTAALLVGASVGGIFLIAGDRTYEEKDTQLSFKWADSGDNTYSITLDLTAEQVRTMRKSTIDKSGTVSSDMYKRSSGGTTETVYGVKDYIVVDDAVKELEGKLAKCYESTYSKAILGRPSLAQFLAWFVQDAIDYEEDGPNTGGMTEYWKYPLETLIDGKGDCEDGSILLAALLTAAGYDAGIFLLPGHAMAAINSEEVLSVMYAGNVHFGYYPVETASKAHSDQRRDIGYLSDRYDYTYFHLYTGYVTAYA